MTYEKTKTALRPGQRYKFKFITYNDSEDHHEVEYLGPVVVGGVPQGINQPTVVSSDSDSDTTTSSSNADAE